MKQTVIGNLGGGAFGFRVPKKTIGYDASGLSDFLVTDFDKSLSVLTRGSINMEVASNSSNSASSVTFTINLPKSYANPPPIFIYVDFRQAHVQGGDFWRGYELLTFPFSPSEYGFGFEGSSGNPPICRLRFVNNNRFDAAIAAQGNNNTQPYVTDARGYYFLLDV